MRQLVSVVTDSTVSYYLAEEDSDEVTQVAQVYNPGLAVPEVIDLGANLLEALRLNGHKSRPRAVKAAPTPALPPAPAPEPVKAAAKRVQSRQPRVSWGLDSQAVLQDLRLHPGTTYPEITHRLIRTDDARAIQSVTAHIHALRRRGHKIQVDYEGVRRVSASGRATGGRQSRLTYIAPQPRPIAQED